MKDTTHVWRVFGALLVALVAAMAVQRLLRPEGYGLAGNYRLGSLDEVMEQEPVHQGRSACAQCHDEIVTVHGKDIHYNVNCEDCHGPGQLHARYHLGQGGEIPEQAAAMPKEYTLEGCLFCHRKLAARPRTFPQIDPVEHYEFLHVKEPGTRCIECHSPHEPLFLLTRVSEARIHPIINECNDCHAGKPEGNHRQVAGHPAIFVCGDCHRPVVNDFARHEHAFLRCTTCHLFHRESDTAGRIFNNGNRRFCLLCHERRSFKDEGAVPQIASGEHVAEMAEAFDIDLAEVENDPRACLRCHFEFIHDRELIEKRGALSHD